eukprot:m.110947 g.110947  ORF g.110947 m.110947 type:complete len:185 (-) comp13416_c1_seq3:1995-2549(-)
MRRSKRVAATSDGAAEAKRGARTADKDGDQAGVDSPKALFALDTPQQYQKYLDLYSQTVAQLPKKSLDTLIASDAWMWGEGRMEIQQRTPPSITSSELQRICMWKFTRGKFRPLMGKIKANPDDLVSEASTRAFAALPDVKKAIEEMTVLKGVGSTGMSCTWRDVCLRLLLLLVYTVELCWLLG